MNKLGLERRTQILTALVEGNSLRATSRMTGAALNTVTKLLVDAGTVCLDFQDKALRNLSCRRIECDEIWSFVGCKEKNRPEEDRGQFGRGDTWTWVALDSESKLVPTWLVGPRDGASASEFMADLASRIKGRVQLTTDGHKVYVQAVEAAFGAEIDYAMLVKMYGTAPEAETRYSPAVCIGCIPQEIQGAPKPELISTSYVERQNLNMRMSMRRFTRLTNGFSKKIENHAAAIALHFAHYNFVRVHRSLRVSPAMAAGITNHLWDMSEIAALVP